MLAYIPDSTVPVTLTPEMAESMKQYVRLLSPMKEFADARRLYSLFSSRNKETKWAGRKMLYQLWRKDVESREYLKKDVDELANTIENLAIGSQIIKVDPMVDGMAEMLGKAMLADAPGNAYN